MQTSPSHTSPGSLLASLAPACAAAPGAADAASGLPAGLSFVEHLGRSTAAGAALLESALAEAKTSRPAPALGLTTVLAAALRESGLGRIEALQGSDENSAVPAGLELAVGRGPVGELAGLHELLAQLLSGAAPAWAEPDTASTEPARARGARFESARRAASVHDASIVQDEASHLDGLPCASRHGVARGSGLEASLGVVPDSVVQQTLGETASASHATPATISATSSGTTPAALAAATAAWAASAAASDTPSGTEPAASRRLYGDARPDDAAPGQAAVRGDGQRGGLGAAVRGEAREGSRDATRLHGGRVDANPSTKPTRADRTDGSGAETDLTASTTNAAPAAAGVTPAASAAQVLAILDAQAVSGAPHQAPRAEIDSAAVASAPQAVLVPVASPWGRLTGERTSERIGERTGERSERIGERAGERAGERIDEFSGATSRERTGDAPGRGFGSGRFDADAPSQSPWSMPPLAAGAAPADGPRVNAFAESAAPSVAQALAGVLPPVPGATPGAAALHIEFAPPVTDPRFREAFALQVSSLARDGVQHAVLQLNPAEMGPISVQIALDGQQAQIHFGCDSALTRGIVESGLPLLAASLREAGLTLSGGGVSQHTPEQREGSNNGGAPHGRRFNAEPEPTPTVHTLRVTTGRLDTYA